MGLVDEEGGFSRIARPCLVLGEMTVERKHETQTAGMRADLDDPVKVVGVKQPVEADERVRSLLSQRAKPTRRPPLNQGLFVLYQWVHSLTKRAWGFQPPGTINFSGLSAMNSSTALRAPGHEPQL